jgi:DNA replication protein DnaC
MNTIESLLAQGYTPAQIEAMRLAEQAAYLESLPPAVYQCAICKDEGWAMNTDGRMGKCACLLQSERATYQKALDDMFPVYAGMTFDTYKPVNESQMDALHHCMTFADFGAGPEGKGILLAGGVGIGKTCLLYLALRGALEHRLLSFERHKTVMLLSRIRSTFNNPKRDGETEHDIIQSLLAVDVLILDDIGVEKASDWVDGIFFAVLDGRLEKKKITLATTNLTSQQTYANAPTLDERLGERLASRKHTLFNVVEMDGSDRRLPKEKV